MFTTDFLANIIVWRWIIEKVGSIALASVALVCPKCDKPTRVGIKLAGDKLVRICRKCEATI